LFNKTVQFELYTGITHFGIKRDREDEVRKKEKINMNESQTETRKWETRRKKEETNREVINNVATKMIMW
jgi:hypothetical protein